MSSEESILIEDRGRVRIIKLNRPDRLNAFNNDQYDALAAALRDAASHPQVSVAILTGEGRAFTAGQDLSELGNRPTYDDDLPHGFEPFMDQLQAFPKPLLAAVNGLGVGIGLTMLLHCDIVFMAKSARLRAPFVSLGVTAEAGSTLLLPQLIGWPETAHLLYTASWVSADRAVEIGLARHCVPDDDLMAETMALAEEMAAMPVTSLMATKRLLLDCRLDGINQARKRETSVFSGLEGGAANKEAITAFVEKRPADFTHILGDG
jgi:enoyl-CoA hydratase/carnithine racemase